MSAPGRRTGRALQPRSAAALCRMARALARAWGCWLAQSTRAAPEAMGGVSSRVTSTGLRWREVSQDRHANEMVFVGPVVPAAAG
jgi:hypothetical protein